MSVDRKQDSKCSSTSTNRAQHDHEDALVDGFIHILHVINEKVKVALRHLNDF